MRLADVATLAMPTSCVRVRHVKCAGHAWTTMKHLFWIVFFGLVLMCSSGDGTAVERPIQTPPLSDIEQALANLSSSDAATQDAAEDALMTTDDVTPLTKLEDMRANADRSVRIDRYLLPALEGGRSILIDFKNVKAALYGFLSAFLATPVKRLEMEAYKKIKIVNATPEIREIIDFIMDENTSSH